MRGEEKKERNEGKIATGKKKEETKKFSGKESEGQVEPSNVFIVKSYLFWRSWSGTSIFAPSGEGTE